MFESVFYEAAKKRAQQAALDTYKASLEYHRVRRDNPSMLEQNYVDFSNPESVARIQSPIVNPYGTYNPYANPNLVQQNYGYNPALYAGNSYGYGGTWYGYGGWGSTDTRFMTPLKDDKLIPIGKVVKGPLTPIQRRTGYLEKLSTKFQVAIVKGNSDPPPQETQQPMVRSVKRSTYHPPMVPYTIEELDTDQGQVRTIPDTPLVWTRRDEEELDRLVEDLAVYDKAMAHVAYNLPIVEGCTREDFTYIKRYFQERIQDFRSKELINPNLDYRAKYRYRKLPATTVVDGDTMPDLSKPVPIPTKQTTLSGETIYDYDRGRDTLTDEEWDVFVDRAYGEMLEGAARIKAQDLLQLNQHLAAVPQQTKKQEDARYNPYDPISARLHQMRTSQKAYETHMGFFKHVFKHQMSPEQFDNWWYGTQTNAIRYSGRQVDQATAQRLWARQQSESNFNLLQQFQPFDKAASEVWFNRTALTAINGYTKGTVTRDMSLADFMQNLRYLDTRNHELNLEAQQRANQQAMWNSMSHDTFNRSLYSYMNSTAYSNPNPYYTPQYGTIDPRFGMPNQFIDLTNNDLAKKKKAEFLDHCHTVQGSVPLSPIYR